MNARRSLAALGILAAATLAPSVAAAPAQAAVSPAAGAQALACDKNMHAKETVIIRNRASASGAAVGQLNKGQDACVSSIVRGSWYNACGTADFEWAKIGTGRYVAASCMVRNG
ncbi:hypothetical protein EV193_11450 [Herbihabitans rhizosphaerae]|uniref:SH3 domain-containing protein n=1 Tax=Herbihabitans rhizosphaerae TaxID=1872711 RepID=A0A4Q7KCW4_9PSEU|nr:hypothetical protein [Herbihabitans rhizosphaerae]RZS31359.1 hypothetical protein EV193_11450 [Herbihabitans rhizosphaerae]